MINKSYFWKKSTLKVAKSLLGCTLVHRTKKGIISGKIVETEAYLHDDPASHSFNGKTPRNDAMFNYPGIAYIYFTYGMHYCFNIVTNRKGIGEAVLIRALEPIKGIDLMKKNRKIDSLHNLCNGPAKLVQALGITKKYNNHDLTKKPLYILTKKSKQKYDLVKTTRIGISQGSALLYRFYIKDNSFVSKK
ncbi:DNA-3-methyladenine glycosylase [Candidatus Pacearchaeota archaeon]|nr:DNA-3-methyladenine glycosylase [Candidatus Pacearchaeota archaeon]